nr:hypothetical protein Iba_chr14cCG10530 [Ipomoea batatas]
MIHLGIYICSLRKSAFYSWPGFCVGLSCGIPDCLLKLAGLEWEIEASLKVDWNNTNIHGRNGNLVTQNQNIPVRFSWHELNSTRSKSLDLAAVLLAIILVPTWLIQF